MLAKVQAPATSQRPFICIARFSIATFGEFLSSLQNCTHFKNSKLYTMDVDQQIPIPEMPTDVWSIIMQMSDASSRKNIALTCKTFRLLHTLLEIPVLRLSEQDTLQSLASLAIERSRHIYMSSESNLQSLKRNLFLSAEKSTSMLSPIVAHRCTSLCVDIDLPCQDLILPKLKRLEL